MLRVRYYCGLVSGTATVDKQVYLNVVDQFFPGYTVFETNGRWAGASEPSIVIEVLSPEVDKGTIVAVGKTLAIAGRQSAVLVTVEKIEDSMLLGME
jgi:hypothetical protein